MIVNWPTRIHTRPALPSVRVHLPYMAPRMTPVEPLDGKTIGQYEAYKAALAALEQEKTAAIEAEAKVQAEYKAAIDAPGKWGRQAAKEALIKRLGEDLAKASSLVQKTKEKIEAHEKINKPLVAYVESHKDLAAFYENHLKTQAEYTKKIKEALEAYDARHSTE
jgi:hypothetical protein